MWVPILYYLLIYCYDKTPRPKATCKTTSLFWLMVPEVESIIVRRRHGRWQKEKKSSWSYFVAEESEKKRERKRENELEVVWVWKLSNIALSEIKSYSKAPHPKKESTTFPNISKSYGQCSSTLTITHIFFLWNYCTCNHMLTKGKPVI